MSEKMRQAMAELDAIVDVTRRGEVAFPLRVIVRGKMYQSDDGINWRSVEPSPRQG